MVWIAMLACKFKPSGQVIECGALHLRRIIRGTPRRGRVGGAHITGTQQQQYQRGEQRAAELAWHLQ